MKIQNIHQRELQIPLEKAGKLLDSLGSNQDKLWPRHAWPPMILNAPLGLGSSGGHGPIRYAVENYQPGISVTFRFTRPEGFLGVHSFTLTSETANSCELKHTISMTIRGAAIFKWWLIIRPLHDALLEDCLDNAQAAAGSQPARKSWSLWVKILRWILKRTKKAVKKQSG